MAKIFTKTLNSILKLKFKNFEVIFIDNCSTDSKEFIKRLYRQAVSLF